MIMKAEDLVEEKFPTLSVYFDTFFGNFFLTPAHDLCDTKSSET